MRAEFAKAVLAEIFSTDARIWEAKASSREEGDRTTDTNRMAPGPFSSHITSIICFRGCDGRRGASVPVAC